MSQARQMICAHSWHHPWQHSRDEKRCYEQHRRSQAAVARRKFRSCDTCLVQQPRYQSCHGLPRDMRSRRLVGGRVKHSGQECFFQIPGYSISESLKTVALRWGYLVSLTVASSTYATLTESRCGWWRCGSSCLHNDHNVVVTNKRFNTKTSCSQNGNDMEERVADWVFA